MRMASNYDTYTTPLTGRYSSREMQQLFSQRSRFSTWRKLWLWLAEAQQELGLPISDAALEEMRTSVDVADDEFGVIREEESRRRHDVMACVHAYGLRAPAAAGQIHWGATSCYVTDGAELIFMRDGLNLLLPKLARIVEQLRRFALKQKDVACLAFTHGQPAQPTTVGKRATLWIQDLLFDLRNLTRVRDDLKFRGAKGTTGTQASFLSIFDNDHAKVERLDRLVAKKAGFGEAYPVVSQTYSRHVDADVVTALSTFGATVQKIGGDLRHLAMMKEVEEPFEKDQIGSSAMAYKRNPMRSERLCSLGRDLMGRSLQMMETFSSQWLERSLDDSAIRRITIPESFLEADACLILMLNITNGLVVYEKVVHRRLMEELPFMATEEILMELVRAGKSRQEGHEHIRVLSHEAGATVKQEGKSNDLLERIRADPFFEPILPKLPELMDPQRFIGRAPQQVEKFCGDHGEVDSALEPWKAAFSQLVEDGVTV